MWCRVSQTHAVYGVINVFSIDEIENPITQNMTSKRPPKSRQPQQDASAPETKPAKRRKKKMIKNEFVYGDNKLLFDLEPRFVLAIISAVAALLGWSTNLVIQARHQSPALPSSQRVAEDSR
jgi:hypothetical protein